MQKSARLQGRSPSLFIWECEVSDFVREMREVYIDMSARKDCSLGLIPGKVFLPLSIGAFVSDPRFGYTNID